MALPFTEDEKQLIKTCKEICIEAHETQIRWNGDPYWKHPERIANYFKELDLPLYNTYFPKNSFISERKYTEFKTICVCAAYLHDVLEDCEDWTSDRLIERGVSSEVIWNVLILTRLKNETYLPYILRLKSSGSQVAYVVKIADIKDNLRDIEKYDVDGKFLDRYQLALYILEHYGTNIKV
jgi:(p)ppGpp synthase/HD superfamily hydrolase